MSEFSVSDFLKDLRQDILARSENELDEATFEESIFTQIVLDYLGDAGEADDAQVCYYKAHGVQCNGYAINDQEDCLELFVTIYKSAETPQTVTKEEVTAAFKRVTSLYDKAKLGLHTQLEESTAAFELLARIHSLYRAFTQIRIILVTDGVTKTPPPKGVDASGVRVTFSIWDAERLFRLVSSGNEREAIEIDLLESSGVVIPCLSTPDASPDYATYLAIFPGNVLVELYGRYGPRLLERNVRSFLQAKGKINTGIRNTILKEPEMFLAFNNGISATAAQVGLETSPNGSIAIRKLTDFQIVNGGQTTASIYHAAKKDKTVQLEKIGVQVKLTVLKDSARMDEIVPRISEYSNSQNKVQTADFAANDAYHRRIEALSRQVWVPAKDGTARQTHWYYERARGQYRDDVFREGSPARQAEFIQKNPKDQLFGKTELAKYLQIWDMKPNVVCRGAQASFNDFMTRLLDHVNREGVLDTRYFERLVAKAILFKSADSIIHKQIKSTHPHLGSLKASIVAYTVAKLVADTKQRLDLGKIYREQRIDDALEQALASYWLTIYNHLATGAGGGHFTMYCRTERCWETLRLTPLKIPYQVLKVTHLPPESDDQISEVPQPRITTISQQLLEIPADEWLQMAEWGLEKRLISGLEREMLSDIATKVAYGQVPNDSRGRQVLALMRRLKTEGFIAKRNNS